MPDINKAYTWVIQTCNAPNIGYNKEGLRNAGVSNGITHYDCSSLMWWGLKVGGFQNIGSYPFTTSGERSKLIDAGFVQVPINGEWRPGDILWRSGHTEMVYEGGQASGVTMGAHSSRYELDRQVSINNYTSYASSWSELYRYADGATGVYGYSPYAIFAILGNIYGECNLNPVIAEHSDGSGGLGLFQWTGSRRTDFENWMNEHGYQLSDGNAQLEFMIYEDDWQRDSRYPEFNSLSDFLNTSITDVDYLVEAWCRCWERAGTERMNVRKNFARSCQNYVQAHANDTSITEPYKTSGSESDALYNAVLIYRYMTAGGGGGGTVSTTREAPVFSQSNKGIVYSAIGRREVVVQWR